MRVMLSRAIAVAAAAAIALTAVTLPASANGYYHRDNGAAAAMAMIGIFGTMAAIIAANQHRHHHYSGPVQYRGPWHGPGVRYPHYDRYR